MGFREIPINRGENVDKVAYDPDSGTLKVSFQRVGSPDYLFYRDGHRWPWFGTGEDVAE